MADKEGKTISRQALYDEIWTDSARKVAEKYEITYSRFLKICKDNNIPVPPSGYRVKLSYNKPVQKSPLPDSKIDVIELIPEKERQKDTDKVIAAESIPVSEEEKIDLQIMREGGIVRIAEMMADSAQGEIHLREATRYYRHRGRLHHSTFR